MLRGSQETQRWFIDGLAKPSKNRALVGDECDIAEAIDGLDEDSKKRFADLREKLLTPFDRVKLGSSSARIKSGEAQRPRRVPQLHVPFLVVGSFDFGVRYAMR